MTSIVSILTVPLEDWRFAWRLDQLDQPMPAQDRERIKPLATVSSKEISDRLYNVNLHRDFPFKQGFFGRCESLALIPVGHQDELLKEDEKVKKWLYQRGIPFAAPVFLVYDSTNVVFTTWKMVIRYWSLFYYSIAHDLTVCDSSLTLCVLFYHEHEIFFGTNRKDLPMEGL